MYLKTAECARVFSVSKTRRRRAKCLVYVNAPKSGAGARKRARRFQIGGKKCYAVQLKRRDPKCFTPIPATP